MKNVSRGYSTNVCLFITLLKMALVTGPATSNDRNRNTLYNILDVVDIITAGLTISVYGVKEYLPAPSHSAFAAQSMAEMPVFLFPAWE